MKKIYISGKITGNENYKKEFEAAEMVLKLAGYYPVNPAREHLPDGATWADYMRHDIKLLCNCDGLYMLKNWQESKGARVEHQLAQNLGLKIYYEGEKNGERLAMKISRHRQAKHEAIQYEDVKTAYINGCEDTARAMPAHSIADIQNAKKEAREIIREYYDRSKDYPTCDNKLVDLRRRALAWLEGEK